MEEKEFSQQVPKEKEQVPPVAPYKAADGAKDDMDHGTLSGESAGTQAGRQCGGGQGPEGQTSCATGSMNPGPDPFHFHASGPMAEGRSGGAAGHMAHEPGERYGRPPQTPQGPAIFAAHNGGGPFQGTAYQHGPFAGNYDPHGQAAYGPHMGDWPQWPGAGPCSQPGWGAHHMGAGGYPPPGPQFHGPGPGHPGAQFQGPEAAPHCAAFNETLGKAIQGQATPQDLIGGLLNLNFQGDQFWKGVLLGSVAALLLNSDSVRTALVGALGGILGSPAQQEQPTDESAK